MPVTTVLSDEGSATIIDNDNAGFTHRFSWSAAFAGAFLATAVTFFLLALGAGFGLALVTARTATTSGFLTGGAIYFLAAQAFGFAAGGHLVGRLIGPAVETIREEEFRSAAHGLIVWALTVVASATLIAIGGMVAGNTALSVAANSQKAQAAETMTPSYIGYWVDILFTPGPSPSQASIAWQKYAQADTGVATDASPATAPDNDTEAPVPTAAPRALQPAPSSSSSASTTTLNSGPPTAPVAPAAPETTFVPSSGPRDQQIPAAPSGFTPPPSLAADKAVAARIIEVGMAKDGRLNAYDKDRIATLVAQDTGLALPDAQRRVDNAEARIHNETVEAEDAARRGISHAALWIALSLLFGGFVSAVAAMSARWEDDKVTFGWPPRREPAA